MVHTTSLEHPRQQTLAMHHELNYGFAQSLLRPVQEIIRYYFVHPGKTTWVVEWAKSPGTHFSVQWNMICTFHLKENCVYLVDCIADFSEYDGLVFLRWSISLDFNGSRGNVQTGNRRFSKGGTIKPRVYERWAFETIWIGIKEITFNWIQK